MRTKVVTLTLLAFAVVLVGAAHLAVAQPAPFSHLRCSKVRDTIPKATYTADEVLDSVRTCIIKVPAKLFCRFTSKTNVTPPPPGGGPNTTLNVQGFFCYKQKCPKFHSSGNPITIKDQFGTHVFPEPITINSSLLCAPASPSGAFLDNPQ